jgi:uncharacterized caspase-like protein
MMKWRIKFLASVILACCVANGAAGAGLRVALVIGNSHYRDVVALPNPEKDANAMAAFLTKAGFDVTRANNLTLSDMRRALRDFADKIAAAGPDVDVVLHYGGHGVQIDGENYLIPVDAHITRESDVPVAAVRLVDVMNILSSVPARDRIVMLDSCRNNPFSAIGKTIGRGYAIVDAPRGSIVSYATAPGTTALDGDGDHSPFIEALLRIAPTPGLPVEQAFKEVRLAVNKATDGVQTPWESSSLISDFSFVPAPDASARQVQTGKMEETTKQASTTKQEAVNKQQEADKQTATKQQATADQSASGQAGVSREPVPVAEWKKRILNVTPEQAYDLVVEVNTVQAYQAFLAVYPNFKYVTQVRVLVERELLMIAWYEAFTLNTVDAYDAFLSQYPDSDMTATAKRLLQRAKNRMLALNGFASANGAPSTGPAASSAPKVITKVVEKPKIITKVIERVKVVEKPVVHERIVKQIVRVPVACRCNRPRGGVIIQAPVGGRHRNSEQNERHHQSPLGGFRGGIILGPPN